MWLVTRLVRAAARRCAAATLPPLSRATPTTPRAQTRSSGVDQHSRGHAMALAPQAEGRATKPATAAESTRGSLFV